MHILLIALSFLLLSNPGPTPSAQSPTAAPFPEAQAELTRANLLIGSQRFREAVEALQRANKLAGGEIRDRRARSCHQARAGRARAFGRLQRE